MMKRLISTILVLCIFLLHIDLIDIVNADVIAGINPVGNIQLIFEDFADDNNVIDTYGCTEIVDVNGERRLLIGGDASRFFGKYYNEELSDRRYCFSYDFYSESDEYTLINRIIGSGSSGIYDTANAFRCIEFESGGAVNVYRSPNGYADRKLQGEWESGIWHSVAIWVDAENKEIEYWLDGEVLANVKLAEEIQGIKGFSVEKPIADCAAKLYIDNISVTCDSDAAAAAFSPIFTEYSIKGNIVGNNFFKDLPPEFDVTFKNRLNRSVEAEVYFKALDENNTVRWQSQNFDYTIEAKATTNTKVEPGLFYGVMKLVVVISVGGKEYEKIIPYSMSNRTSDTPVNKRSGVATHIDRGKEDTEKILPLLSKAGFGTVRDGIILWSEVEQEKGVYSFPQEYDEFLKLCQAYDIDYINYFRGHGIYGANGDSEGYPPSTEESFTALEKYMEEVAKWSNGRIFAMEVFNEYNNSNMTGPYTYRYDVFANMHKAMWNGLKKYDSDIYVAGLAEDNWSTNKMQVTEEYIKAMNGGKYFDSVATHPYVPDFDVPEHGVTAALRDKTTQNLNKYGYSPDIPRFATEIGWSSAMCDFNDKKQGCYFPRIMQLTLMEDSLDRVCWYSAADYPDANDDNMSEATYGLVEGCNETDVEVPYLAKSGFVMAAYYNNLFANSVPLTDYSDTEVFSYHSRSRSGNDILMLGVIDDTSKAVSYNLGCLSVTVGDAYGNEHMLYSHNGVYDFVLNPYEITYIQGNFSSVAECESGFAVDEINRIVEENEEVEIKLTADKGFDGKLVVDSSCGVEVLTADTAFANGTATAKLKVLSEKTSFAQVSFRVEKDGKIYFYPTVELDYKLSTSEAVGEVEFETDFEIMPKFFKSVYKGAEAKLVNTDTLHQKALHIYRQYENAESGYMESLVDFRTSVRQGVLKLSYSQKLSGNSANLLQYVYVVNEKGLQDCFAVLGTTEQSSYVNGWRGSKAELPALVANEWSLIDIVIDFDNDCAYLYRDGVLIDYSVELMVDEICGIMFQSHSGDKTDGGVCFDDLKISTMQDDICVTKTEISGKDIVLYLNNTLKDGSFSLERKKAVANEGIEPFESGGYSSVYLGSNTHLGWKLYETFNTNTTVAEHIQGDKGIRTTGNYVQTVAYNLGNLPVAPEYTINISYDAMFKGTDMNGASKNYSLEAYLLENNGQSVWANNTRTRLLTMNYIGSNSISCWTGTSPYMSSATEIKLVDSVEMNKWYTFDYSIRMGEAGNHIADYKVLDSDGKALAEEKEKILMNESFEKPYQLAFVMNTNNTDSSTDTLKGTWIDNLSIDYTYEYDVEIIKVGTDEKIIADVKVLSNRILQLTVPYELEKGEEYAVIIPNDTRLESVYGKTTDILSFNIPRKEETVNIVTETFDDSKWNKSSFNPHYTNGKWPAGWYPTVGGQYDSAMAQVYENGEYYMKLGDGGTTNIPHSPSGSGLKYALPKLPDKSSVTVRYDVKILPGSGTTSSNRAGLSSAVATELNPSTMNNSQNLRLGFDIGFVGGSGATNANKFVQHGGTWTSSVENIDDSVFNADNWYTCETVWNIDTNNSKTYAQYRAWDKLSGKEAFTPLTNQIPSLSASFVPKAAGVVLWGSERTTQILLDNMEIFYTYLPTGIKHFRTAVNGESKIPTGKISADTETLLLEFTGRTDAVAYLTEEDGSKTALSGTTTGTVYEWNIKELLVPNQKYNLLVVYDNGDKTFERSFLAVDENEAAISNYGIYNADGSRVSKWSDIKDITKLYVNADIGIKSGVNDNATLTFVLLEKGILIDTGFITAKDCVASNGKYLLEKPFSMSEKCDEIRCFLWTDGKNIKPLTKGIKILKNQ